MCHDFRHVANDIISSLTMKQTLPFAGPSKGMSNKEEFAELEDRIEKEVKLIADGNVFMCKEILKHIALLCQEGRFAEDNLLLQQSDELSSCPWQAPVFKATAVKLSLLKSMLIDN